MSRNAGGAVAHGPFFAVVTADLVGSRQLADRAEAQRRLSHLVKHLNRTMRKHLAVPFMITLGDEVQGLFGDITRVSEAVIRIHEIFHPKEITVGIGVGTLATRLARRVTEMDGPAFIRSRSAVELAKKKRREVIVETGDRQDAAVNAVYALLGGLMVGWTVVQWQRFNLYRRLGTDEAVARQLGVARQSVSKSLRNTLRERILEIEAQLPGIFASIGTGSPRTRVDQADRSGGRSARHTV